MVAIKVGRKWDKVELKELKGKLLTQKLQSESPAYYTERETGN